jgi:hypothetical protein
MSATTMVIYLKNPKIKQWLTQKAKILTAKKGSLKSTSSLVADILEKEYEQETAKNPLLRFSGLAKQVRNEDWKEFDDSIAEFRTNWKSKPESFYDNLTNE